MALRSKSKARITKFFLAELVAIDILFKDKGYVEKFIKELREEKDIRLYALKRSNSKNPLYKNLEIKYHI